jgi:hypothetical protein
LRILLVTVLFLGIATATGREMTVWAKSEKAVQKASSKSLVIQHPDCSVQVSGSGQAPKLSPLIRQGHLDRLKPPRAEPGSATGWWCDRGEWRAQAWIQDSGGRDWWMVLRVGGDHSLELTPKESGSGLRPIRRFGSWGDSKSLDRCDVTSRTPWTRFVGIKDSKKREIEISVSCR